ncbi:phosphotransferase family protein [Tepidicaulis sp. LMO-SS28]|uniref:phosphotransferase family protein n=1 Tax=Tepidicaulis sp. LMO-SS28 TaxID=3447455 RepID=UPI003EE3FFCF
MIDRNLNGDLLGKIRGLLERGEGEPVGGGLEFQIYRFDDGAHSYAVRVPRASIFRNANDPNTSAKALLKQEHAIVSHCLSACLPAVRSYGVGTGGPCGSFLVQDYIEHDESEYGPEETGRVLAAIHAMPVPFERTVAHEGMPFARLVGQRLIRRAERLSKISGAILNMPSANEVERCLSDRPHAHRLLHLDVRPSNMLCVRGRLIALIDWSNALVGDPNMEVARAQEYELPVARIMQGYRQVRELEPVNDDVFTLYRLDAAIMLALVFASEAPDAERAKRQLVRVMQLLTTLSP